MFHLKLTIMTKEIILVEVVNGSDLSTEHCKAFTSNAAADEYFTYLIGKYQITDDGETIEEFIEDGYCDFDYFGERKSIITKCIIYEEDCL